MKSASLMILTLACALAAQDPAPAPEKRRDPAALDLIKRFDELVYVPRSAVADLEFSTKLPSGHHLVLKWKAPDKVRADLVVPADASPAVARQLGLVIPKFQEEARKHAGKFVDMVLGEVLSEKHKDDDVILVAPKQVRIVARADATKATMKEETLTFDADGMIKQTKVTSPTGLESTIEPTFGPSNGKVVYLTLKTKVAASQEDSTVTLDYAAVDGVVLLKKATISAKAGDKARESTLEFFDFKVNRGMEDKVFEVKPAEPKPGG